MKCRVCGKELSKFDDIIWRCEGDNHKHTAIINVHNDIVEFESIRVYKDSTTYFNFIYNYLVNYSQIARGKRHSNFHEDEVPIYHERGMLEFDFSSMEKLMEKLDTLEIFS